MSRPITLRVRGEQWTVVAFGPCGDVRATVAGSDAASVLGGVGLSTEHRPLPLPVVLAMAALYTGAA